MRTMMSTESAASSEPSKIVEFCGGATTAILGTTSGHVENPMACAPACRSLSNSAITGLLLSISAGNSVPERSEERRVGKEGGVVLVVAAEGGDENGVLRPRGSR